MRLALDTNVMAYAEGLTFADSDKAKHRIALSLVGAMAGHEMVLAIQALCELHRVLVRKGRRSPIESSRAVRAWTRRVELVGAGEAVFEAGLDLAARHGLQIFDALIMAAEARCDLLLTEDLQDGFAWRGVVATNPFGPTPDDRIARMLAAG